MILFPSTAMRVDAAILTVVVAFLLPLRLLSLVVRLKSAGSAVDLRRSCTAFAIVAALLATIFALPRDHVGRARECAASVAVADAGDEGFRLEVRSEVEQLKLQLARLESFWENDSKSLDGKFDALEEDDEIVKAMGLDIQSLIKEQRNIKESLCSSDSTIKSVENEVQILMDESAQMNSNIHQIWSLAKDTKKRVEDLYADIEKVHFQIDESRKLESNIYKMWSFAKQTQKRVDDLYSDVKKGFKKKGIKVPSWMN